MQYEGAVKEDGRGPTIWDTFSHTFGKITDFSNADVAVDQYHRYEVTLNLYYKLTMFLNYVYTYPKENEVISFNSNYKMARAGRCTAHEEHGNGRL